MNLSISQLAILRHMLGIDDPAQRDPQPSRNYYCANPGDVELRELAELGAVELASGPRPGLPYDTYHCTPAGIAAARASHRLLRWSKPKRVYRRFLEVSDAFNDLTFHRFLTDPDFRQIRAEA